MLTKFGKLAVGKHVVSVKQRNPGDSIFPLAIALSGLHPLTKVWVDYEPLPKNNFVIKINDADFFALVKEEVDYDPSQTETLNVELNINDKKDKYGAEEWTIYGDMPWIIDDVSDKVENSLGMEHLTSLYINYLKCKSWVANEFLDMMCSYDLPEQGLNKLRLE